MEITSKQRAFLRSLSNKLETILIVGKGGITDTLIKQADDALTAREIIKGKVLETSPADADHIAGELAQKTNALLVHVIGSKFVLYRRNPKNPIITLPKARKK